MEVSELNAFLSVSDKEQIVPQAKALHSLKVKLYASGGTAATVAEAGIPVIDIQPFAGPASFHGKVKTLHPWVYGGLLGDESPEEIADLEAIAGVRFDIVFVDYYPLKAAIAKPGATLESVRKDTDIGGPSMTRAGAKGGRMVAATPRNRQRIIDWLKEGRPNPDVLQRDLAADAEAIAADYSLVSAEFLGEGKYAGMIGARVEKLKYGENPHQPDATLYVTEEGRTNPFGPLSWKRMDEGMPPSWVNHTDRDSALKTMRRLATSLRAHLDGSLPRITIIVKHGHVCGLGIDSVMYESARKAIEGDAAAAFGGTVMTNYHVDEKIAEICYTHKGKRVMDCFVAPSFDKEGMDKLERVHGKCRMYRNPALREDSLLATLSLAKEVRQVEGGFQVQDPNLFVPYIHDEWKSGLTDEQQIDLLIAGAIAHTNVSNTIVVAKGGMFLGMGMAQPSRVRAADFAVIAARKYGKHKLKGAAAWSDSFFPFEDGPEPLAKAGVKVLFATEGGMRAKYIKEACEQAGLLLLQLPDAVARGFARH